MKADKIYSPQIYQLRPFLLKKFIAEPTRTSRKNSRWAILVLLRVLLPAHLQRTKRIFKAPAALLSIFCPHGITPSNYVSAYQSIVVKP